MKINEIFEGIDLQKNIDYIDVRIENTKTSSITMVNHNTVNAIEEMNFGAFIRAYNNGRWFYKSTSAIDDLQKEIDGLIYIAKSFSGAKSGIFDNIKEFSGEKILFEDCDIKRTDLKTKGKLLKEYDNISKSYEKIKMVQSFYIDKSSDISFMSSKGVNFRYDFSGAEVRLVAMLSDKDKQYYDSFSAFRDTFEKLKGAEEKIKSSIEESEKFLYAPLCTPGAYPLIMSPETAGVFAHESFGHKSEADFMVGDENMKREWSIGKKVGSEKLSIIDYGDIPGLSGYTPFDDEGTQSKKTYLIKNGILTGRLHSVSTSRDLNESATGNGRAINAEFEPIVRMTNTYIDKGESTFDELVSKVGDGFFIKSIKHGSGLSTFTIAPAKSYRIEKGKIGECVKINVITGSIFQTLNDISDISNEVVLKSSLMGGCGKGEQYPLRVSFGGPYVLVNNMNVA